MTARRGLRPLRTGVSLSLVTYLPFSVPLPFSLLPERRHAVYQHVLRRGNCYKAFGVVSLRVSSRLPNYVTTRLAFPPLHLRLPLPFLLLFPDIFFNNIILSNAYSPDQHRSSLSTSLFSANLFIFMYESIN